MSTATISPATINQPAAKLKPKEHGAYAILAVPIVTAIVTAGPTVAGICIALAAVTGFLAHEPLLVVVGHRGSRARRTTPAAIKRLITLLAVTIACGSIAMIVGSNAVRLSLTLCGLFATTSFALTVLGRHRTLGGQLVGVIGLSVPCVPILLAGGFSTSQAAEVWASWLIGFAATTMAVRGVIACQKGQSRLIHWVSLMALSSLTAALSIAGFSLPLVTLPMLIMSWYLLLDPPPAKQLRRVGWTLVAGTVASAIWMLIWV